MRFQPKSEDKLEQEREMKWLLDPGPYWAEVIEAEDQVSKKGNEMIKIKLAVVDSNGSHHIYDYLGTFMEFKIRHFCKSAGKLDVYERGSLSAEDILHWRVIAQLGVEKKEGYSDKNNVQDYFLESECAGPIGPHSESEAVRVVESTSDLPF